MVHSICPCPVLAVTLYIQIPILMPNVVNHIHTIHSVIHAVETHIHGKCLSGFGYVCVCVCASKANEKLEPKAKLGSFACDVVAVTFCFWFLRLVLYRAKLSFSLRPWSENQTQHQKCTLFQMKMHNNDMNESNEFAFHITLARQLMNWHRSFIVIWSVLITMSFDSPWKCFQKICARLGRSVIWYEKWD